MFALDPRDDPFATITFEIFEWDISSGPVGDALYSVQKDWPDAGGDVLIDDIGLELSEGELFATSESSFQAAPPRGRPAG